jgi:hypothetical protein
MLPSRLLKRIDDLRGSRRPTDAHDRAYPAPCIDHGENPETAPIEQLIVHFRLTKAAELAEAGVAETLIYYSFPEEHWWRILTNNPLERLLREISQRTRVVGAFPDGQSALNLAAAGC